MQDFRAFLNRYASDPRAGWVMLSGQTKPLDLSAAARKLLAGMDDKDNPLVDHDAAVCRSIRFMWSMMGYDAKRKVEAWFPSYEAYVTAQQLNDTYTLTHEDFKRRAA